MKTAAESWGPIEMNNNLNSATNTTEEYEEIIAFQRSSLMGRSPNSSEAGHPDHAGAPNTPRGARGKQLTFCQLGEQIKILVEMLSDKKRRSIHQPMRDAVERISSLYDLCSGGPHKCIVKGAIQIDRESQTLPWIRPQQPKRKSDMENDAPLSKRKDMPKNISNTEATEKENSEVNKESAHTSKKDEGWTKASSKIRRKKGPRKKTPNKNKVMKPRPDAIAIAINGEISYADILRKVKTDPKLEELGKAVSKIRRTQKGDLLLQFGDSGQKAETFASAIEESLGDQATIRSLSETSKKKIIEIKDIDEITTKDEIHQALVSQFSLGSFALEDIVSLRQAYGGTKIATIAIAADSFSAIASTGKVKIGWVNCRIREKERLTKCFKCLEYGHIARNCRNQCDRSKCCRRCSEEGHIAKDCRNDLLCMFCKTDKSKDAKHVAGSRMCPLFKKALSAKRRQ